MIFKNEKYKKKVFMKTFPTVFLKITQVFLVGIYLLIVKFSTS